jgi:pimeloyl-ACP methyl ester carboxylesterase
MLHLKYHAPGLPWYTELRYSGRLTVAGNRMRVLLAHGLGRTRRSFFLLSRRLSAAGHTPEYFSYSARSGTHEEILAGLVTKLQALAATGTEAGLVGHSFGGLLLREAIAVTPGLRVRHLFMLGTPHRPPRLALALYPVFSPRFRPGTCRECLVDAAWFRRLPALTVPYTVVAGTGGWRGPLSPFKGAANDGAVAVSETLVKPADHPVTVPLPHTFLMNSRPVARLIIEALAPSSS